MFIANMKLSTNFVKYNKWCHPCAPFFVIRVADTGIYFACNSNCVLA
ncbi:hypothetical protein OZD63_04575 [Wolbachia endosymbiont of Drosophila leontia]|nr:hypothetical protein [Wolbachia endosymbiont of Drosophila leontia]